VPSGPAEIKRFAPGDRKIIAAGSAYRPSGAGESPRLRAYLACTVSVCAGLALRAPTRRDPETGSVTDRAPLAPGPVHRDGFLNRR